MADGNVLPGLAGQFLQQGGLVGFDGDHVVGAGGQDRVRGGGLGMQSVGGDHRTDGAFAQSGDEVGQGRDLVRLRLDGPLGDHRPARVVESCDQVMDPLGGRAGASEDTRSTGVTRRRSTRVVRVQAYRHSSVSRAPASRRANSLRRFDSPGTDLSPNAVSEWPARVAAHSPIAVKPRRPARAAEMVTWSRPGRGHLLPRARRGSGSRAR